MERFFNTAGPVEPEIHYCIDPLTRIDLPEVLRLIEQRKYFVLHAPRQTGKTSALLALARRLNEEGRYLCSYVNVEGAQSLGRDQAVAARMIVADLAGAASFYCGDSWPARNWRRLADDRGPGALGALLAEWSQASTRPIVLLIDEIDTLVGDFLIAVLRQIRAGYPQRPEAFPQSIILCGVRDVRDYRIHTSGHEIITGGSAFNIKAESLRVGSFTPREVAELLHQHTAATGQAFADSAVERVYGLTQGQPWLVNALAYEICFRKGPGSDRTVTVTPSMVDAAKEALIARRDTHLDQLTDKLREERVRRVIEPMLADEGEPEQIPTDDISYVHDLGLITVHPQLAIANPIYQEIIPRELTFSTQVTITHHTAWYVDAATGRLDMGRLLEAFQGFFRQNADAWLERFDYKEAGPHLLLQAFLQRVVNGGGSITREYGLGRLRTDLLVTWPLPDGTVQKEVLELKLLRRPLDATIAKGLEQTAAYMDSAGVSTGHLLIFDRTPGRSWEEKIFRRDERVGERRVGVWGM